MEGDSSIKNLTNPVFGTIYELLHLSLYVDQQYTNIVSGAPGVSKTTIDLISVTLEIRKKFQHNQGATLLKYLRLNRYALRFRRVIDIFLLGLYRRKMDERGNDGRHKSSFILP